MEFFFCEISSFQKQSTLDLSYMCQTKIALKIHTYINTPRQNQNKNIQIVYKYKETILKKGTNIMFDPSCKYCYIRYSTCIKHLSGQNINYLLQEIIIYFFLFGFIIRHTNWEDVIRYRHFPALLIEEDPMCASVPYFRNEQAPRLNQWHSVSKLDSFLTWKKLMSLAGFKPTVVRSKWFEVNNLNYLCMDAPTAAKNLTISAVRVARHRSCEWGPECWNPVWLHMDLLLRTLQKEIHIYKKTPPHIKTFRT
jgi:hypothetical protein